MRLVWGGHACLGTKEGALAFSWDISGWAAFVAQGLGDVPWAIVMSSSLLSAAPSIPVVVPASGSESMSGDSNDSNEPWIQAKERRPGKGKVQDKIKILGGFPET